MASGLGNSVDIWQCFVMLRAGGGGAARRGARGAPPRPRRLGAPATAIGRGVERVGRGAVPSGGSCEQRARGGPRRRGRGRRGRAPAPAGSPAAAPTY